MAPTDFVALGLAWYVVFVFSVTVHEAAHALLAMKLGDPTAYHGGQVTLDPVPHMRREPFGMIVVPLLSYVLGGWMFGWASTPYDPGWAARHPRRAAWMGLAGPGGNLALILLAGVLIHAGIAAGWFYAPPAITFSTVVEARAVGPAKAAAVLLSLLFSLNLLLLIFNLLPLPPLDGTAWMELVLRGEVLLRYRQLIAHPQARLVGLVLAWIFFDVVFGPVHHVAINLLYPGAGYH